VELFQEKREQQVAIR